MNIGVWHYVYRQSDIINFSLNITKKAVLITYTIKHD